MCFEGRGELKDEAFVDIRHNSVDSADTGCPQMVIFIVAILAIREVPSIELLEGARCSKNNLFIII